MMHSRRCDAWPPWMNSSHQSQYWVLRAFASNKKSGVKSFTVFWARSKNVSRLRVVLLFTLYLLPLATARSWGRGCHGLKSIKIFRRRKLALFLRIIRREAFSLHYSNVGMRIIFRCQNNFKISLSVKGSPGCHHLNRICYNVYFEEGNLF